MAPNPHHDDAGNTRYRVLVAGQQYLCSEHESNVTVVTPSRATKVWAVKELHSDLKFSGELKGVWFDVDCNSAVNSSRSHDEQPRWRTTFENQCASLYTVSNYGDFMLSLAQLVPILDRMRLAGFIHGDISPLNCLVHTRDRHIKISDIEHARQYYFEDEGSPPPQIGVPHFMAVEYQRDRYYFDDDVCAVEFQFNFVHDLESILWMYVWLLLYSLPDCLRAHNTLEKCESIQTCREMLFDGSFEGSFQRNLYIKEFVRTQRDLMHCLEPLYAQANALPLLEGFTSAVHLVTCYKEVQSTKPLRSGNRTPSRWPSASFKASHYSKIHDIFMSVHDAVKDVDYQAISHVNFQRRAAAGLEPPVSTVNQESDETPTPSLKRRDEFTGAQERNKKSKKGFGVRVGKRRAEDELEKEVVKKAQVYASCETQSVCGEEKANGQGSSSSRSFSSS